MTMIPFTAMVPATSSFAMGLEVPMPTFPVLRENRFGGLSQKFQLSHRKGPTSLRLGVVVPGVLTVEVGCVLGDAAFTAENAVVMQIKHTPMLSTSLKVRA
jgi:hypothetical protein